MTTTFREVRRLQGERVRMRFDDGREVVAVLLCATKDIDGSKHLIYDKVEPVPGAEASVSGATGCVHADLNRLVNIDLADVKDAAQTIHGWDCLDLQNCA